MNWLVVFELSQSGCGAYPPDLSGVGVVAESKEEAEDLVRTAIQLHIEALKEKGEPVPVPTASAEWIRFHNSNHLQ